MDPFLKSHRIWLITLVVLVSSLAAWTLFARVDIVVTAQGKLLPTSFVNLAQPLETAIVRKLHARDGARVSVGDHTSPNQKAEPLEDATHQAYKPRWY